MPFAFDLLDEEQKKKQQADPTQMGAPAMTGGGETFAGGGQPQPQQQDQAQKGTLKQGSGFVGLDKYMTANKGNQFGQQFTGQVQNTVNQGKTDLNQGADQVKGASTQGAVLWNNVGNDIKSVIDTAGDNLSQDSIKKVQNTAKARYQGPENFTGTAQGVRAQGSVQKANQQANAMQSEGGRFALLDQYYGRPKYTQGQKSLDNLLVQNTPGVQARAQSISDQAKNLAAEGAKTAQDVDNFITSNKAATSEAAKQTQDYLNQAKSGFQSNLQSKYDQYVKSIDDYNSQLASDLDRGVMRGDRESGLSALPEMNTYGLGREASRYLTPGQKASLSEVAADEDYARYLALSQLAGEDPTLLSASQRAQAGSGLSKGKAQFDMDRFGNEVASRKSEFEQKVGPLSSAAILGVPGAAEQYQALLDEYGQKDFFSGEPIIRR